jgi:YVTN family beta-propeller protein
MKLTGSIAILAIVALCVLGSAQTLAQNAYITNGSDGTVSVIDTTTNTVTATIAVGNLPFGVAVTPDASAVYITNFSDNTVSVIDTSSNTVTATIPVGREPLGVAVTPDGRLVYVTNRADSTVSVIDPAVKGSWRQRNHYTRLYHRKSMIFPPIAVGHVPAGVAISPDGSTVYVVNQADNTVSVIDTLTNTVTGSPITVGFSPFGVAITPDGNTVYVTNSDDDTVSVIDTTTKTVIRSPIPVGVDPLGVTVSADGSTVYVTNLLDNTVSVIATPTNTVIATIPVPGADLGVAITPDGSAVYIANENFLDTGTVSVIDTASNTVIGSPIPVGRGSIAFGVFIQPPPKFAGDPERSNCYTQSVEALARQFGGLNTAAAALGLRSMQSVQAAIVTYCHDRPTIAGSHR